MEIIRNRPSRSQALPVTGEGTNIKDGAVIMPGVTAGTDLSVFIRATGAAADCFGLLAEAYTSTSAVDADPEAGTLYPLKLAVPFLPGCEVAADLQDDADNDVDVASSTSTVITITSSEDNIDGSWVYVRAGTGIGQVGYLTAAAAGTVTLKSALTTTLDSTSKLLILRRVGHKLVELVTAADKIKSTAAAGTLPWRVIENQFRYQGQEIWIRLDPTKHHNLQLNGLAPVFRQILSPVNTFHSPTVN